MQWTTPLGWPVVQSYRKKKNVVVVRRRSFLLPRGKRLM
jgi:DNA-directed RNA polymerase